MRNVNRGMIYAHDPSATGPSSVTGRDMDTHSLHERVEAAASQALNNSFNRRTDYIGIDMDDGASVSTNGTQDDSLQARPPGDLARENSTAEAATNLRESYNQLRQVVNQHENGPSLVFDNIVILSLIFVGYFSFISLNRRTKDLTYTTSTRRGIGYRALLFVWALATSLLMAQNYIAVEDFDTLKALSFQYSGEKYHGFLDTLLFVILLDVFTKATTCCIKLAVLFSPGRLISHHHKRNIFQCLEYFSQSYRCALPIIQWSCYFLGVDRSFGEAAFTDLSLAILYLICKSREIVVYLKVFVECAWRICTVVPVGAVPSRLEIERENMCSVCHDEYTNPTKLNCDHIFCLSCIERWLESTDTCPICRAVVEKANNQYKGGATSNFIRIY